MTRTRLLRSLAVIVLAAPALPGAAASGPPAAPALASLRVIGKTGGRISADGLTATVVVKYREGIAARAADPGVGEIAAKIAAAAVPGGVRPTFDRTAEA